MNPQQDQPPPEPSEPSQPETPPPDPDNIFVISKPEKKPLDKKGITIVSLLTLLGIAFLLGVLVFVLIGSANSLADDYRRQEIAGLEKINLPLKNLEPSLAINQQNIDDQLSKIMLSQKSQPELGSVIYASSWSGRYQQTEQIKHVAEGHYQDVVVYANQLKQVISFDKAVQDIFDQDPNYTSAIAANPNDSFTIRSISGSYDDLAKQIENIPAPPQIKSLHSQLVAVYKDKSAAYLTWAVRLEQKNAAGVAAAKKTITDDTTQAVTITDEQNYIDAFKDSYKKVIASQKQLENNLAR